MQRCCLLDGGFIENISTTLTIHDQGRAYSNVHKLVKCRLRSDHKASQFTNCNDISTTLTIHDQGRAYLSMHKLVKCQSSEI